MVLTWPRISMNVPSRQLGRTSFTIFCMIVRHAAQVAAVHVRVHVVHRLHVVVIHDRDRRTAAHGGQVAEQLRRAPPPGAVIGVRFRASKESMR